MAKAGLLAALALGWGAAAFGAGALTGFFIVPEAGGGGGLLTAEEEGGGGLLDDDDEEEGGGGLKDAGDGVPLLLFADGGGGGLNPPGGFGFETTAEAGEVLMDSPFCLACNFRCISPNMPPPPPPGGGAIGEGIPPPPPPPPPRDTGADPPPPEDTATAGVLRSFTFWGFFNFLPFWISAKKPASAILCFLNNED